ncbi:VWA domain-containing protein [Microbacterium sp. JZ31]|uniref:VWA domain-containing protein n=1 Tax=Microbacterium sp. JZ31 TaxID=1906274 RepID=UPI001931B540|nr:VWA domain-containing protein [Microbacterium sp. JZ31]
MTVAAEAAWEAAQALWGVRMHAPVPKPDAHEASFAWFGFPAEISYDPIALDRVGCAAFLESVFAHELGHHALAPSTRIDSLKIRYQMARALAASDPLGGVDTAAQAPRYANIWSDMLINVRVAQAQRADDPDREPEMIRMWRVLSAPVIAHGDAGAETDPAWWVVMRAYEMLWALPAGSLCVAAAPHRLRDEAAAAAEQARNLGEVDPADIQLPRGFGSRYRGDYADAERRRRAAEINRERAEAQVHPALSLDPELDARFLADTVRVFGADPISGALSFGMILGPYVSALHAAGMEGAVAGGAGGTGGCAEDQGAAATAEELERVLSDGRLRETPLHPSLTLADAGSVPETPDAERRAGQGFGLARTLALFSASERAAVLAAWYQSEAAPFVAPLRAPRSVPARSDLLGALETWEVGDDLADLDWPGTLARGAAVIPGVTTRRRDLLPDDPVREQRPVTLDLYVDSSGSMPHPDRGSPAVLAGMILVQSVLRGGGRVRVSSFSSPGQVASFEKFTRDRLQITSTLCTFFGGGTVFPLDLLASRYLSDRSVVRRGERRQLVVLSDSGVASFFGAWQDQYADVAPRVLPLVESGTLVVVPDAWSRKQGYGAGDTGYEVMEVETMTDAPAVCARLARRIMQAGAAA